MKPVPRIVIPVFLLLGCPAATQASEPERAITDVERRHWSFRPPVRPGLPEGDSPNPIDRFISARLAEKGLTVAPEADRRTLLRRVTFDLTGLPPTPADIEAFLNDPSPTAYEPVIDRLLSSPAYGERWAQHWLDVALSLIHI